MDIKALREKSTVELHKELTALLREQFNLRMQKGAGEPPRAHLFKEVRRNIARIMTVLNEKKGD